MRYSFRGLLCLSTALVLIAGSMTAQAGPLMDRINSGKPIRIGFANLEPWAYEGNGQKPLGFVVAITLGVLGKMGYDRIEPITSSWSGLIPGLNANRFDIITSAMFITKRRCKELAFSEPIGVFGDAFIVAKGNPKSLNNYQNLRNKNGMFVTGVGYDTIETAINEGVPASRIMRVPGPTEILEAIKSGHADAGGVTYFTAIHLAKESGGLVDVTEPTDLPKSTLNWVGIGFRNSDRDFLVKFNTALKKYIGSDEMMAVVTKYGYSESQLPGDQKTSWVCANR